MLTGASDNLDAMQRVHIEAVLQRCGWRINGPGNAAERLGVTVVGFVRDGRFNVYTHPERIAL